MHLHRSRFVKIREAWSTCIAPVPRSLTRCYKKLSAPRLHWLKPTATRSGSNLKEKRNGPPAAPDLLHRDLTDPTYVQLRFGQPHFLAVPTGCGYFYPKKSGNRLRDRKGKHPVSTKRSRRLSRLSSMPWKPWTAKGTDVSWPNRPVGTQSCATPPRPLSRTASPRRSAAPRRALPSLALPRPAPLVRYPGFGFENKNYCAFRNVPCMKMFFRKKTSTHWSAEGLGMKTGLSSFQNLKVLNIFLEIRIYEFTYRFDEPKVQKYPVRGQGFAGMGQVPARRFRARTGEAGQHNAASGQPFVSTCKRSKTAVLDVSPAARTYQILCKPFRGTRCAVDKCLVSGLSAGPNTLSLPNAD